jgi:ferredoxin
MKINDKNILICNCEKTMDIDGKKLCSALGNEGTLNVHSNLCRTEIDTFNQSLESGEPVLVACTQEAPLFHELHEENSSTTELSFVNIRERAGWSQAGSKVIPKIAALLTEAAFDVKPAGTTNITSDGVCLVYGNGEQALEVAHKLGGRLSVTLVLKTSADMVPPAVATFPIYQGEIAGIKGHFGDFEIVVDRYAPIVPSSKSSLDFQMERNGVSSHCSLIFDMTGDTPLISTHERRDGYFHVDPDMPGAVAQAMFEISDLVGEFDKPIYVTYDETICAHSRSGKVGCNQCLDICPASAIDPNGDNILIDPIICGGCGSCSSVCPTGAVSYDYPDRVSLIERARILLQTYRQAKGKDPVLFIHDESYGSELISMMARFGRGLPTNVIAFGVNEITQIGHEFLSSCLAFGATRIIFLVNQKRRDEMAGLYAQADLTNSILKAMGYGEGDRVLLIDEHDPDIVEEQLYNGLDQPGLEPQNFEAVGTKRDIARTAFLKLNENAPDPQKHIALSQGAPFGRIVIDADKCTLCQACIGACPADALADNPERPELRFTEAACVQCALCRSTCPESALTLEPRLNLTTEAMTPIVLRQEDPFECIRCGKEFGTKSSIEHIISKLAGKHAMFGDAASQDLIRMCDDCRVIEQMVNPADEPMKMGQRPTIRTTEDYITAEQNLDADNEADRLKAEDFLSNKD